MPAPSLAGRSGKILSRFPAFMRAPMPGKALAHVAGALGGDLDESERIMTLIQRSHRLAVAGEERDILSLAALCDLHEADFFILDRLWDHGYFVPSAPASTPGDPPPVQAARDRQRFKDGYGDFLGRLRANVARAVALAFEGCGTIWALLEGTAILLDADRVGPVTASDARGVLHLDDGLPRGGFVHALPITFHTWKDGKADRSKGSVFLVENPLTAHETPDLPRIQRETFRVKRGGFLDGTVAVQVTGVSNRTVRPMVINQTDHEGFLFDGALAEGQKLVYTTDGKVLLDGVDVTAKSVFFTGALFTSGGPRDSRFSPSPTPSPSSTDDVVVQITPERGLQRNFPRPALAPATQLPALDLRLGESTWRFSVEEGVYDASGFDRAVFAFPQPRRRISIAPPSPSGRVQLSWLENEPFAASVLIPSDLRTLQDAKIVDEDLPSLVRAGLERFRAGGIRLDVSYFDETWVLGHSVLKNLTAPAGSGVSFDATVPAAPTVLQPPSPPTP